jgi:hypothetical protein
VASRFLCNFGVIRSDGQGDALFKIIHGGIDVFAIRMGVSKRPADWW